MSRKNHIYILKTCELSGHPRNMGYFSNFDAAEATLQHYLDVERKFRMMQTGQCYDTNEVRADHYIYDNCILCYSVGDLRSGFTFYYIQKRVLWDEPKIF